MIRYHLDEHLPTAVAKGLRARGIDVTTSADASLLSSSDPEHLAYALVEQRVIVTNDADFLRMAKLEMEHSGIVYCRQTAASIGDTLRALILIYECLSAEEMHNHVEFI